ncbi:MAG: universal stress protein [Methanothrix sp.]|jgi:nucleotide-binding universal stress UspA family protein|uniref:universal stress protein n=1 Tax=Methanothrix sp. TaxID=90426 RepID=UPI00247EA31E|nr:universal stress protein [Methanothrix sp.]
MIEKIMIATDGSETSERAARFGVELARNLGARVIAVYVADTGRLSHLPDEMILVGIRDMLLKEGEDATSYVESIASNAGVACEKRVVEGKPTDEILKLSRDLNVDMLVMGSVGRSGLDRFLLGSVAEKVVQHSRVPVLTVPGERKEG